MNDVDRPAGYKVDRIVWYMLHAALVLLAMAVAYRVVMDARGQ